MNVICASHVTETTSNYSTSTVIKNNHDTT